MYSQNVRIEALDGKGLADEQYIQNLKKEARKNKIPLKSDPEMLALLEHIDFNVISRIFKRLAERCNVDPDSVSNMSLDDLWLMKHATNIGEWHDESDLVCLNPYIFRELNVDERAKQLFALQTLIHEYVHGLSCLYLKDFDSKHKNHQARRSGFKSKLAKSRIFFDAFDEGLTEIIAVDLTNQYLEETGWMSMAEANELRKRMPLSLTEEVLEAIQFHLKLIVGIPAIRRRTELPLIYEEEQEVCRKLLEYLSKVAGVSEEVVLQAFVREKLEGQVDLFTEWKSMFIDLMGKEKGSKLFQSIAVMHTMIDESKADLNKQLKSLLNENLI